MPLPDHRSGSNVHRQPEARPLKRRSRDIHPFGTGSPPTELLDAPSFSTRRSPIFSQAEPFALNDLDFAMQPHSGGDLPSHGDDLFADVLFSPHQKPPAGPTVGESLFDNTKAQELDTRECCLRRLTSLSSRLFHDFNNTNSVKLPDLLSFSPCRNLTAPNQATDCPQNIIGRVLESSHTFLDILHGLAPDPRPTSSSDSECSYSNYWEDDEFVPISDEMTYNSTSARPEFRDSSDMCASSSNRDSSDLSAASPTIDMPTTLTILTCYTWLLQAYDTIFSQIYSSLLAGTDSTSPSMPPVLPGLQIGGFSLDQHCDLQIEILIQLSARMLDRIEGKLGVTDTKDSNAPVDDQEWSRNGSILDTASASTILDALFKQNHSETRAKPGKGARAGSVRNIMKNIRAELTVHK
ncbi:Zn(II)2Cys6 domain-containing transcription factor fsqA [Aspergillus clavatus NRRL 1]|nr:uncharacterized protein ACLA_078640 [Aspergillus clavatus NRRL 1]EAW09115.1 hypothetical protein ACLA_078640 [Aspergillus clavatus NRRL 1]